MEKKRDRGVWGRTRDRDWGLDRKIGLWTRREGKKINGKIICLQTYGMCTMCDANRWRKGKRRSLGGTVTCFLLLLLLLIAHVMHDARDASDGPMLQRHMPRPSMQVA
jgi:hypothetical protein